tara:strand:- start:64 stop:276 length:213 start_codon:yes stop_codon:yes gene_type:complete
MSNQNAILYDNLLRRHTSIQNQINAIPQLSIEEQSRLVDINEKYSPENQEKVNNLKQQLVVLEQQLKQLF